MAFSLPFACNRGPNACDRERISVRRLASDYKRIQANWIYLDSLIIAYYNIPYRKLNEKGNTMENAIITTSNSQLEVIKQLVTDGLTSKYSKVMYAKNLDDFLSWYQDQGAPGLSKAIIQHYKNHLLELNYAPATINQKLVAVRRLAIEAVDNNLLDPAMLEGIRRIKGVPMEGVRTGNWITLDQAQMLINTPDITTLKGIRDRAILAVMLNSGLRRSEIAKLTFDHIQQRNGRWVIVDMIGKRNRVRSVPIASWAKQAIDEWAQTAQISAGHVFRPINKGDRIVGDHLTSQAIQNVVKDYASRTGLNISAHDMRRTFAQMTYQAGAPLDQIQLSLGHASIQTTERYLGTKQNLSIAPADMMKLHLE